MANDNLNEVFVPLVLAEVLKFLFGLVRDIPRPLRQLSRAILRVFELLPQDLLDFLLRFLHI